AVAMARARDPQALERAMRSAVHVAEEVVRDRDDDLAGGAGLCALDGLAHAIDVELVFESHHHEPLAPPPPERPPPPLKPPNPPPPIPPPPRRPLAIMLQNNSIASRGLVTNRTRSTTSAIAPNTIWSMLEPPRGGGGRSASGATAVPPGSSPSRDSTWSTAPVIAVSGFPAASAGAITSRTIRDA